MSADLIQRLRNPAAAPNWAAADRYMIEAAAELAALTRERDRLQGIARDAAEAATEHQREVLRLRAELDALKRQEPVAALVRWRTLTTEARIAFDGQDHYSEWEQWVPATLAYAKAVTDETRNSDPRLYEMRPLYDAPTPAAAKPQETGANTRESICAALLVGLPLSADQRASLLVMLRTAGDAEALHTFLNAAAGEGLVLDGVDAADIYMAVFPERYASTIASIDDSRAALAADAGRAKTEGGE